MLSILYGSLELLCFISFLILLLLNMLLYTYTFNSTRTVNLL